MRAIIHAVDDSAPGARDVAGRPLLARQLQWLRTQGIEEVAVEIGLSEPEVELADWLLSDDPLVHRCLVVPTEGHVGVDELLRRTGFDLEDGLLALPADVLCEVDLEPWVERAQLQSLELSPPDGLQVSGAELELRFLVGDGETQTVTAPHWGARVDSEKAALELACAALTGELRGVQVHASETQPGVWVARGARIAPTAQLIAPVLVGGGAFVATGAALGPRAVIGDRAVIERGVRVVDGRVLPGTIVGEDVEVRRALAGPHRLSALTGQEQLEIHDDLVLEARTVTPRLAWSSRLVALSLCLVLLIPWLIAATVSLLLGRRAIVGEQWPDGTWLRNGSLGIGVLDAWPRLVDTTLGRRFLVGATSPAAGVCPAAFDVGSGLAPGAPIQVRQRMWTWYAARKSRALDWTLLSGG